MKRNFQLGPYSISSEELWDAPSLLDLIKRKRGEKDWLLRKPIVDIENLGGVAQMQASTSQRTVDESISQASGEHLYRKYLNGLQSAVHFNVADNPKYIGKGSSGTVFDAGGGVAVKVVEDIDEAKLCAFLVGKNVSGINKFHAVATPADKKNIFFIFSTKVNTNSSDIQEAYNELKVMFMDIETSPMGSILSWEKESHSDNYTAPVVNKLSNLRISTKAKQLVNGMHFLNQNGVHYPDLGPENIGVDPKGNLVITDLGIADHSKTGHIIKI